MEAIVELVAALAMAVVHMVVAVVSLVMFAVAVVVEFIFVLMFGGLSAAKERFGQRQKAHSEAIEKRQQVHIEQTTRSETPSVASPSRSTSPNPFALAVIAIVVVGGIVAAIFHQISEEMRKRKIAATDVQIGRLADEFKAKINEGKIDDLPTGFLKESDAWNKPLEVFVDDIEIGAMVVVRSAGADQQTGTLDDQLAIRTTRIPVKEVAENLKKKLKEKAGQKSNDLLDKLRDKFKKK